MPQTVTDAIVSSIVDDLNAGVGLEWNLACFRISRAVRTLRLEAGKVESVITAEQRAAIDAAIRTAQPAIVGEPPIADFRIMVCALHIVTGEWANPRRSAATGALPNVVEAFILCRMLDNHLDNANLRSVLERKRAQMAPEQWRLLGTMVEEIYPLPLAASAEATPCFGETVH